MDIITNNTGFMSYDENLNHKQYIVTHLFRFASAIIIPRHYSHSNKTQTKQDLAIRRKLISTMCSLVWFHLEFKHKRYSKLAECCQPFIRQLQQLATVPVKTWVWGKYDFGFIVHKTPSDRKSSWLKCEGNAKFYPNIIVWMQYLLRTQFVLRTKFV